LGARCCLVGKARHALTRWLKRAASPITGQSAFHHNRSKSNLWILRDLAVIVVLGSGIQLWLSRRSSPHVEAELMASRGT
jgi:hypothetical protein